MASRDTFRFTFELPAAVTAETDKERSERRNLQLIDAVEENDVTKVDGLLKEGADPASRKKVTYAHSRRDKENDITVWEELTLDAEIAISLAIIYGYTGVLTSLLRKGADPNCEISLADKRGNDIAAVTGEKKDHHKRMIHLQRDLNALSREKDTLRQTINVLEIEKQDLQSRVETFQRDVAALTTENEDLQRPCSALDRDLDALKGQIEQTPSLIAAAAEDGAGPNEQEARGIMPREDAEVSTSMKRAFAVVDGLSWVAHVAVGVVIGFLIAHSFRWR
ncbi:hypothetical protein M427DRAFT_68188 [Gonapodya prolifera JEL478]|uniref:Ankyrin n=1 Tax=Gonapodya prolifera (strain JEL478) TaxID=1344416 RepID=A0A139AMR4_GONPJ|nr:hypothetical protein M427DRAFT_68188 [Gonapodya prolifera JEL478]|eukprot:KXS18057.1 hypothetical protein M427DRAFT_68188 [Gonapodya prolifera JEL478]